jgi:HSP20 family protein
MRTLLGKKEDTGNPFALMRRLTDDIDRAFGLKPGYAGMPEPFVGTWSPELEIFERDNTFFVRVDLPGLTKTDVKVSVAHDELTIEGERKIEREEQKEDFYRTERSYGGFYRRIPLPEHVKAEAAKATFKHGVLEIEMPTIPIPEAKKRTLEIQG